MARAPLFQRLMALLHLSFVLTHECNHEVANPPGVGRLRRCSSLVHNLMQRPVQKYGPVLVADGGV